MPKSGKVLKTEGTGFFIIIRRVITRECGRKKMQNKVDAMKYLWYDTKQSKDVRLFREGERALPG